MQHIATLILQLAFQFSLLPGSDALARSMPPFLMKSIAEHYLDQLKDGSTFLQHAPQKLAASYLGITQGSLSRIPEWLIKAEVLPTSARMRAVLIPPSMEADPAYEKLRCFTDRLVKLNEADWVRFRDPFRPIHLAKGEHWLQAGDVCGHVGFVVSGLIHAYYIAQGEQVTQEFYFENTYATSYVSFLTGQPSQRHLQALEDTHLLILSRDDLYRFYSGSQDAERMGRLIAEAAFMRFDNRTQQFLLKPPEQRYLDLLQDRPNVMQRVPQKHVASYLGIQPESLSRIRKRIAKG